MDAALLTRSVDELTKQHRTFKSTVTKEKTKLERLNEDLDRRVCGGVVTRVCRPCRRSPAVCVRMSDGVFVSSSPLCHAPSFSLFLSLSLSLSLSHSLSLAFSLSLTLSLSHTHTHVSLVLSFVTHTLPTL
jgi:hypothetical protein